MGGGGEKEMGVRWEEEMGGRDGEGGGEYAGRRRERKDSGEGEERARGW